MTEAIGSKADSSFHTTYSDTYSDTVEATKTLLDGVGEVIKCGEFDLAETLIINLVVKCTTQEKCNSIEMLKLISQSS